MLLNKPSSSESRDVQFQEQSPPTAETSDNGTHSPKRRNKTPFVVAAILIVVVAAAAIAYNYFGNLHAEKKPPKRAIPVTISTAVQKTIPVEINVIGTVQAYTTVQVKSQVIGQLTKVHFKQGDFVKKGDILFTIDPRQLDAQLEQTMAIEMKDKAQVRQAQANVTKDIALVKQAEAAVARDKSQLSLASREAKRYETLVNVGAVSHEQYDQQKTTEDTSHSTVASDEAMLGSMQATLEADKAVANSLQAQANADHAMVRNMQVQLGYTTIRSPIDGRTGSLNIYQGNLIKDNDVTPLISIDEITPIYVTFSIPEQYLNEVAKCNKQAPLKVLTFIEGDKTPEEGAVTFIDNQVDSTTGTISLKGTFQNNDKRLWPGQFVNVVLILKEEPNMLLIPAHAVQTGQDGQFVWILKSDSTVEQRPVKMARTAKGSAVITEGMTVGEQVITDGQMQLTPGAAVEPKKSISEDD
jgi:membrane fusion protein, multidrug efflux system